MVAGQFQSKSAGPLPAQILNRVTFFFLKKYAQESCLLYQLKGLKNPPVSLYCSILHGQRQQLIGTKAWMLKSKHSKLSKVSNIKTHQTELYTVFTSKF